MIFFRKIIFTICIIGLLPFVALAATKDYLIVSMEFADGVFTQAGAEEYALDSADARIYASGTYEMRLYEGGQMIGNNFFEIPENGEMETIGIADKNTGIRAYGTTTPVSQIVQVSLPLVKSISPEDASIQILKGGQTLFDKKLSEFEVNVISANTNRVLIKIPPPPAPPSLSEETAQTEAKPEPSSRSGNSLLWIIIGLVLAAGIFALYEKGKIRSIYEKFRR